MPATPDDPAPPPCSATSTLPSLPALRVMRLDAVGHDPARADGSIRHDVVPPCGVCVFPKSASFAEIAAEKFQHARPTLLRRFGVIGRMRVVVIGVVRRRIAVEFDRLRRLLERVPPSRARRRSCDRLALMNLDGAWQLVGLPNTLQRLAVAVASRDAEPWCRNRPRRI